MKKSLPLKIPASILILALASCTTSPTNQQIGTVTGGVLGGVLGSQVGQGTGRSIAIVAGTLAGAFLGSAIGQSMDQTDRMKTAQVMESNPTGTASSWQNPDTGDTYTVTPTRTYQSNSGPCRDFTTNAVVNGQKEVINGKACRQPDGSWKMM